MSEEEKEDELRDEGSALDEDRRKKFFALSNAKSYLNSALDKLSSVEGRLKYIIDYFSELVLSPEKLKADLEFIHDKLDEALTTGRHCEEELKVL